MFKSPESRYALRIVVMALLAGLAALKSNITDGLTSSEAVEVLYLTLGAGAAYAGLGAAVPAVEPFIGNKKDDAEVPVPPADPVPPGR
jgi:hypothetical protein